ncbi:Alg9-like mannosyltransferase family-domain-containing protein [Chaetomium strumarium]|uniref:Mannosyltransferase n=1 Tax=Chaetomium strumarium TaxID=1170767 RepID=A0AAJ0M695_9PEZI|nr:Alg9-like mannosyltransferase family-domain-containing protein [Chaetomium strumarium]
MAPLEDAQLGAKAVTNAKKHSNGAPAAGLLDSFLYLLIPGLILVHLVVAPYTKVEESFNIQAAHDVLVYGTPTSNIHQRLSSSYDHFTFPGAVPRTFVGPVLLAGFAQPIVALVGFQHAQLVVRAILGLFNAACLLVFARNLRRAYGAGTARWYLLFQASQFHIMFYASRTLPNMFAFGLTTLAFALLLPEPSNPKSTARRQRLSIAMFVFAATIFRAEVALLLGATILHLLLIPALSLERILFPFSVSFLTALVTSVPIDSYFWQRPLWPELWGFYYNVVRGSASNWGVSPWHYYFTSAVPRLLVNPLSYAILIPHSLYHPSLRRAATRLALPSLLFIAIYSLQPHKETRFIFYAVPPLTAAASLSANFVFTRRGKSALSFLCAAALLLSVLATFLASTAMLALSALNYPGGEALDHLRSAIVLSSPPPPPHEPSSDNGGVVVEGLGLGVGLVPVVVHVHADVLACMTGVTLFQSSTAESMVDAGAVSLIGDPKSNNEGGVIKTKKTRTGTKQQDISGGHRTGSGRTVMMLDKTEDKSVLARPEFWRQFDYLLVEDPQKVVGGQWETVGVVKGYAGIEIVKPGREKSRDSEEEEADKEGRRGGEPAVNVVGMGRTVAVWKKRVRALTGGWWIGPRMVERIYILSRRSAQEETGTRWGSAVEAR